MTSVFAASVNVFTGIDECVVYLEEIASRPSFKFWAPADRGEVKIELLFCHKESAICSIETVADSCLLCNGDIIPVGGVVISIRVRVLVTSIWVSQFDQVHGCAIVKSDRVTIDDGICVVRHHTISSASLGVTGHDVTFSGGVNKSEGGC